jgi:hypothetical protein
MCDREIISASTAEVARNHPCAGGSGYVVLRVYVQALQITTCALQGRATQLVCNRMGFSVVVSRLVSASGRT